MQKRLSTPTLAVRLCVLVCLSRERERNLDLLLLFRLLWLSLLSYLILRGRGSALVAGWFSVGDVNLPGPDVQVLALLLQGGQQLLTKNLQFY